MSGAVQNSRIAYYPPFDALRAATPQTKGRARMGIVLLLLALSPCACAAHARQPASFYLMVPVIDSSTGALPGQSSLHWRWNINGTYETATACANARQEALDKRLRVEAETEAVPPQLRNSIYADMDRQLGWPSGLNATHPHWGSESMYRSFCIASDDPRLAK
jgi:hypothetical protein